MAKRQKKCFYPFLIDPWTSSFKNVIVEVKGKAECYLHNFFAPI